MWRGHVVVPRLPNSSAKTLPPSLMQNVSQMLPWSPQRKVERTIPRSPSKTSLGPRIESRLWVTEATLLQPPDYAQDRAHSPYSCWVTLMFVRVKIYIFIHTVKKCVRQSWDPKVWGPSMLYLSTTANSSEQSLKPCTLMYVRWLCFFFLTMCT